MKNLAGTFKKLSNQGASALSESEISAIEKEYGSVQAFYLAYTMGDALSDVYTAESGEQQLNPTLKTKLLDAFETQKQRKAGFTFDWFTAFLQPRLSYALSFILILSLGLSVHFSRNAAEFSPNGVKMHENLVVDSTLQLHVDSNVTVHDSLKL